uniref:Uncharacterized protein n=2 Tax=Opuntia streptacantha TaxID=393608 RepID=A0A7C9AGV1_OPUST
MMYSRSILLYPNLTNCVRHHNQRRRLRRLDQTFPKCLMSRHRWTSRYKAHLWNNSYKKEGQTRKGRQEAVEVTQAVCAEAVEPKSEPTYAESWAADAESIGGLPIALEERLSEGCTQNKKFQVQQLGHLHMETIDLVH